MDSSFLGHLRQRNYPSFLEFFFGEQFFDLKADHT